MTPKVTIIIPVYKVEKYLDRCISSMVSQTLKEIEIVIVDDGSPDSCPQICDDWANRDSRIKVLHKKNQGLGFARNSGLELATGEYVIFCDSDDWVEPQTYEVVYNKAKELNLDICWFQRCWVDDDGNKSLGNPVSEEYFIGEEKMAWFRKEIIGANPLDVNSKTRNISSCMALTRRSLFEATTLRYPSEREIASEDFVFLVQFIKCVKSVGILPYTFYNYYVNPLSISHTYSDAKHDRLIRLMEFLYKYCNTEYNWEEVKYNYYGHLLNIFKVILRFSARGNIGFFEKVKLIKKETNHALLKPFYLDSVIKKYAARERLYIWMMKHHISLFFIILYKHKKR